MMPARPVTSRGARRHGGVGMPEFLVALLLFSGAVAGLLSTQLAGKRALAEAHQRVVATALAGDLLERLRGNPTQLGAYEIDILGDPLQPAPEPPLDCTVADCTPGQLAAHDLWQWERALLGAAERSGSAYAGGLPAARACVQRTGDTVRVALSWRGLLATSDPGAPACAGQPAGLYDAPGGEGGNSRLRRLVLFSGYVGPTP